LAQVPRSQDAPARSLTGAQIADLGSALYAESPETQAYFAERWQRGVFHNAPSRIDPVRLETAQRVGEIVHRAIRWELPEQDADLRELLRRYAWEEGIVEGQQNQDAVEGAYDLLQRVRGSDIFRWVQASRAVYREVPFTYHTEHRTIRGVIDLLMQDADGSWRLVDYKTGWLGEWATDDSLALNARRYHFQMAVYAAAVQELVGTPPLVYIHYIRYAQTVMIHEPEWREALAALEQVIEDVIEHG
jgi:ATP-dependent exoDNAse (exonuclease V) beta subunit